jgi:hypothetical protein
MKSDAGRLTPRQHLALPVIAAEPTVDGAAEKIGVTRKTIYEWLKQEAFKKAVEEARKDFVESAFRTMWLSAKKAAEEIVYRLGDYDPKVSLRAAEDIIEFAKDFISLEDHERRIAELEQQLEKRQAESGQRRPPWRASA